MEFVMDALGAVGLALLGLFAWSLRASVARDRAAGAARAQEERVRREREAREAARRRRGARLRCLGCGHRFLGPLPDTGCPECHLAALVVTEEEYKEEQRKEYQHGDKDDTGEAAD